MGNAVLSETGFFVKTLYKLLKYLHWRLIAISIFYLTLSGCNNISCVSIFSYYTKLYYSNLYSYSITMFHAISVQSIFPILHTKVMQKQSISYILFQNKINRINEVKIITIWKLSLNSFQWYAVNWEIK